MKNKDKKIHTAVKKILGEIWIGLDKLHQLTNERLYSLKITMTDYDGKKYEALYNQFKVKSKLLIKD